MTEENTEKDWNIYKEKPNKENANYLLSYLKIILISASQEFFELLDENKLKLHHVFSFNAILAHAIDYMVFIAKKHSDISRSNFIKTFN